MKRIKILGIVILLVFSTIFIPYPVNSDPAETIYVDINNTTEPWDGTSENPYQHIQDGIDNAMSGDTVFVKDGIYYERIVIDKTINLIGENRYTTVIDGNQIGDVVSINANNVLLRNFTVQRSGSGTMPDYDAGIELTSDSNTISENIIRITPRCGIFIVSSSFNTISLNTINHTKYGVYLQHSSQENIISENRITEILDGYGIGLEDSCEKNVISQNIINFTLSDMRHFKGIQLQDSSLNSITDNILQQTFTIIPPGGSQIGISVSSSSYTIITHNVVGGIFYSIICEQSGNSIISENRITGPGRGDGAFGIEVAYSVNNIISGNTIANTSNSIILFSVTNSNITNNVINHSMIGIVGYQSPYNTFTRNTISNSNYGICFVDQSNTNTVFHNNFISNGESVFNNIEYPPCNNIWDNGYASRGNYWSDYTGIDGDGDGIGDTPYPINGSNDQDQYPFIAPNGWTKRLQISAPNQVVKNTQFQVAITVNNIPINQVWLNFSGEIYYTDLQGKATLTAPEVTQNTEMHIAAHKEGYYNDSVSITILNNTTPSTPTLIINTPSSANEGEHFQITVTANNLPVNQVKIVFDNTEYYTNSDGALDLIAPLVDHDSSYSISASKTGYLSAETWITIRNQYNESIHLISPNGNESWNGNQTIEWTITVPESLQLYEVTIQYQYAFGSWVPLVTIRKNITIPYDWNTRTIPDGYPYRIKVSLRKDNDHDGIYELLVDEDTSDAPFTIDNSNTHLGWIRGFIKETIQNVTIPLNEVSVYVILSNVDNVITSKCTLTNESGFYQLAIRTGVYTVVATKTGYNTTAVHNVNLWVNETTEVNFTMTRGIAETNLFLFTEYRAEINQAIQNHFVGGEISILKKKDMSGYEDYVFMYDSITIVPAEVTDGYIVLQISGEQVMLGGKTLLINLDQHVLDITKEIELRYDDEPLQRATDFPDILNPNDDGLHAEYYLIQDSQGSFLAISIPHFSEHTIIIHTVTRVSEGLSVGFAVLLFFSCFIILGAFYFIPYFYVRARKNK